MAIIDILEESRSGSQPIGGSPEFTRVFSVKMSAPVPAGVIVAACGVSLGSPHPDFPRAVVVQVSVDEGRIEEAPPESIEEENEEIKRELQENTPFPLPPDEILETELPVLRRAEESSE
jgi:hypothetical protein